MKLRIKPELYMSTEDGKSYSLARIVELLLTLRSEGNLRAACALLGISYRAGWDMLTDLEQRLGGEVVEMTRGRGTKLTEIGERLVWAHKLIGARLDPILQSMAIEVDAEIQGVISKARNNLKIFASHGFAIARLGQELQRIDASVDLTYHGSVEALSALTRGMCDIAGFHVPIGALETALLTQLKELLRPPLVLIGLATRRQGLMVAAGNPKRIWKIEDLFQPSINFVNRQQGSGTRLILDLLLAQEGRSGMNLNGFERVELTHAAIAAYVASGKADVGIGVETAARQFDLDFVPLLTERYFLACSEDLLTDVRFKPVLQFIQTSEFRSELNKLAGYDASITGEVMTLSEAFPNLIKLQKNC
jgi:molybdate transport repressor ModE-like protein